MKQLFFLPRLSILSIAIILTASIIVVADMGCAPKPACGNKRDHRRRKKRVKAFAPSMSYGYLTTKKTYEYPIG